MAGNIHECPLCSKPLRISGSSKAGFCEVHKKWFPLTQDHAALEEAARLNKEFQDKQESIKTQRQREYNERKAAEARAERNSAVAKILIVLAVVVIAVAAVAWFVLIPNANYSEADSLLAQGNYAGAMEKFEALGGHKDSADKVFLCQALIDLQNNDVTAAMERLDVLEQSENKSLADTLRTSLIPVVSNWQSHGISPDAMLQLIKRIDAFDPEGQLDRAALVTDVHVALLGGEGVLTWQVADMNADGENDLVVLGEDLSVAAYRMIEDGNAKVTLDHAMEAERLIAFGDSYAESDPAMALNCYQKAWEIRQDSTSAAKMAGAYQARATQAEAAGDYDSALADAQTASDALKTAEGFTFYYDMFLRSCYAQADGSVAVSLWDAFRDANSGALLSFGKDAEARTVAGELRLSYAASLASWKDAACPQWLREARELGLDITEALNSAIERYDVGKTRTELRLLALEIYENDSEQYAAQKQLLADEVAQTLTNWKSMSMEAQDVFASLRSAQVLEIPLDPAQAHAAYQDAAMAVAADRRLTMSAFVDYDGDGWEELLGVAEDGALLYYALGDEFALVSEHQDGLNAPVFTEIAGETPVVLAEAADKSGFGVYLWQEGALVKGIGANTIVNYVREGNDISYDVVLEGTHLRCEQYVCSLAFPTTEPELTGVNWQQDNYPMPETAIDALTRYFEAKAYGLTEEMEVLTAAQAVNISGYTLENAAALAAPAVPGTVEAAAFDVAESQVLYEIVYGEKRAYAAVVCEDGAWKIAGASDVFSAAAADAPHDLSAPLLALNESVTAKLADKKDGHVYRLLVSAGSRVQMIWQAGDKQGSREAFSVRLYNSNDLTTPVIAYELTLATAKQMSTPLFLAPGVYYVAVEPISWQDCEYTLLMQAEQDLYVEMEDNDTLPKANSVELNQAYTGSLFDKNDVDVYAFTLEGPTAVNVQLSAELGDSKQTRYQMTLANRANGYVMSTAALAGNELQASTGKVYLSAGEYVVQITRGNSWSGWEYQMTVEASADANTEVEMNNTPETANAIPVNTTVSGSFAVDGDVDCYAFTLDAPAVVQPRMTFDPLENSGKTYVMTVMHGADKLLTVNIGGKESSKVVAPLALPAGTYTVKIENTRFVQQGYQLNVVAQAAEYTEAEINNEMAQATVMPVGQMVTGVLTTAEDVDMYKLVLEEDMTATLKFSFPQNTIKSTAYSVYLEQNGKALWNTNVKGEVGGFEQAMQIPAGTYFVRVKAGEWTASVYTIGLE